MLVDTYERSLPLTDPGRVWVVTNADFADLTRAQLPDVPPGNILGEPMGRSSAPAVALAVARIARNEPEAVVLATPADSHIGDPAAYRDYVGTAVEAASEDFIVILGVVPAHPDTGYGYIRRGRRLARPAAGAYRVDQFTEKPDERTAERYLDDGGYYWNMGQFIFRAGFFMDRLRVHLPEVAAAMSRLAEAGDPSGQEGEDAYRDLPTVSMDYGIAEREENMAVVPTALEWSDVGNWRSVKDIAARHGSGLARTGEHVAVDSRNCFVVAESGRLIVTVGLEDYVVVDTDDALLIVHEDKAQDVRAALEEIEKRGEEDHL
jgi:mannose-1-phosphate guanylyltransferase/mannose-6-phosphate isomerase